MMKAAAKHKLLLVIEIYSQSIIYHIAVDGSAMSLLT